MSKDRCMHPDCGCLDYCESEDPHSATPRRTNIIDEVSPRYTLRDDVRYVPLVGKRHNTAVPAEHWPFDVMQVGECFDEFDIMLFDRVRVCASLFGYQNSKKFATRVIDHGDGITFSVRVWRIE
jgi:hypothetical protein